VPVARKMPRAQPLRAERDLLVALCCWATLGFLHRRPSKGRYVRRRY
jgi:hypothetical protein